MRRIGEEEYGCVDGVQRVCGTYRVAMGHGREGVHPWRWRRRSDEWLGMHV
jgi:hypothetical protein